MPYLVAVMGETASGKTHLAEALADELSAKLINADSFQIYRGLDIGTAKPTENERYELIDIRNANEGFGTGEFVRLSLELLEASWDRRQSVIVVGGTGLNIRALFEEYSEMLAPPNPELRKELNAQLEREGLSSLVEKLKLLDAAAFERVDLANPVRVIRAIERARGAQESVKFRLPDFQRAKFAIENPSDILNSRIEYRVREMVQNGWTLEIERLREQGYRQSDPGFRAIGYRAMWEVVEERKDLEEAIADTVVETRQYAKRQRTWLRSEPNLIRLTADPERNVVRQALSCLANGMS